MAHRQRRVHVHLPAGVTGPQAEGQVLPQFPLTGLGRELVVAEPRVDRAAPLQAHVLEHVPVHQQTARPGRRHLPDDTVLVVEHHTGHRIRVVDEHRGHRTLGGHDHAQRPEHLDVTLDRTGDQPVQRVGLEHHVRVDEPQPVGLGRVVQELDDEPVACLGEVRPRLDRHVVPQQAQVDRCRRLRAAERLPRLNGPLTVEDVELDVAPQEPGGDVVTAAREGEQRTAGMLVHASSCDRRRLAGQRRGPGHPKATRPHVGRGSVESVRSGRS